MAKKEKRMQRYKDKGTEILSCIKLVIQRYKRLKDHRISQPSLRLSNVYILCRRTEGVKDCKRCYHKILLRRRKRDKRKPKRQSVCGKRDGS